MPSRIPQSPAHALYYNNFTGSLFASLLFGQASVYIYGHVYRLRGDQKFFSVAEFSEKLTGMSVQTKRNANESKCILKKAAFFLVIEYSQRE